MLSLAHRRSQIPLTLTLSRRERGLRFGLSRGTDGEDMWRANYACIALSEMSLRHQAPDQRMHLTAR